MPFAPPRLALAASLLCIVAAASAEEPRAVTFRAQWDLDLDADGVVTALQLRSPLMPALVAPLEQAIRDWHFLAGQRDGRPRPTQTTLYVEMTASPDGQGHSRIRFDRAYTGSRYGSIVRPKYPESAMSGGREGLVLLRVVYDAQGHVDTVEPAPDAPKVHHGLLVAATNSVRHWTFVPERVDGIPIAGGALVPVCFMMRPDRGSVVCKWKEPNSDAEREGEDMAAIDPVARLVTDVAGKLL